jgi:uncharacterized protein (DUF849 family)
MVGAEERVAHIAECLPEICTLDCGTMNFAEADYVMTNTPGMLRAMGGMMTGLGVKPEIEAFDTGHLWFAKELVKEGVLEPPALVQLCMGVPWGAPDDLNTFMAMVNNVPDDWNFGLLAGAQPDGLCCGGRAGGRAMCASGSRTISGLARANWPPTPSWSSAP